MCERVVKTYRCVECKREWERQWRDLNPEKDKEIRARETRKNADGYKRRFYEYTERKGKEEMSRQRTERQNRRRLKELLATPAWYDKNKVMEFYKKRDRLTEDTGIPHHVDHIIPLNVDSTARITFKFSPPLKTNPKATRLYSNN